MLDGHSDWCSYDRLYWDRSINQERQREIWRAKKRNENEGGRRREMTNLERLAKKVGERHPKAEMVPVAAASGLVREAAEYFHLADSWAHDGHIYHEGAAIVELGDVLHYLVLACLEHQITLEELARVNLIKIDARAKGEERAFDKVMQSIGQTLELDEALDELETALAVVSR